MFWTLLLFIFYTFSYSVQEKIEPIVKEAAYSQEKFDSILKEAALKYRY